MEQKRPLRLAFRASEGVVEQKRPLCLAFRAREGKGSWLEDKPPLRRVSSEGDGRGGGGRAERPLRLAFGAKEGRGTNSMRLRRICVPRG